MSERKLGTQVAVANSSNENLFLVSIKDGKSRHPFDSDIEGFFRLGHLWEEPLYVSRELATTTSRAKRMGELIFFSDLKCGETRELKLAGFNNLPVILTRDHCDGRLKLVPKK